MENFSNDNPNMKEIFTPYITVNGKRIYRKNGKVFHFFVPDDGSAPTDNNESKK